MASELIIEVVNQPDIDEVIQVTPIIPGSGSLQTISLTFKAARTAVGQVAIGSSVNQTANNIKNAIDVDYNSTLLYSISRVGSTVTIESNNLYVEFDTPFVNTAAPDIAVTVNNDAITNFEITDVIGEGAPSDPCDNIKITVTCSEQADEINVPISAPVATNPYSFVTTRQEGVRSVVMTRIGGSGNDTDGENILIPRLLAAFFETEIVVNAAAEGTLTVVPQAGIYTNGTATPLVTLEYSINNVDWQSSPIFTGLAQGDFTLYIRDNVGCSITIDFSVSEFNPNLVDYEPIVEISNINSLAYKRVTTWDDDSPRSPYTTLSYEEDTELPNRHYKQLLTTLDTAIKTQVKTNYDAVSATLVDCDGNETALTVTKVTDNMDKSDVRDGTMVVQEYNGVNYRGIIFGAGNTYDPDTLLANGIYNLGENLPSWVNAGDYFNVEGLGWVEVLDIVYRATDQAYCAIINLLDADAPIAVGTYKITSVYNVVDFERYEFSLDCSGLLGDYYVRVNVTDATESEVVFRSEWFDVQTSHPKTHRIDYYNTEANEILFSTGIAFRLRVPYVLQLRWKPETDLDIYVTDTNTVPIDTEYRPQWEINLRPLPFRMAEKVVLALLQDRLTIDGVSYVCEGKPESKNLGSLYQIKATLTKQDYVFDSNSGQAGEITLGSGEPLEIDDNANGLLYVD